LHLKGKIISFHSFKISEKIQKTTDDIQKIIAKILELECTPTLALVVRKKIENILNHPFVNFFLAGNLVKKLIQKEIEKNENEDSFSEFLGKTLRKIHEIKIYSQK